MTIVVIISSSILVLLVIRLVIIIFIKYYTFSQPCKQAQFKTPRASDSADF